MSRRRHFLRTTALGLVLGSAGPAAADAVLDGTTGSTGTFSGSFEIPAAVGRRAGGNLFHSFERFSVLRGESATFTGPAGIDNVISRVTGEEASRINGRLASTIPGADFFFLNPNGVVFGPEASLDVDGSFHVSTADELRFDDGSIFSARDPAASSFTVAAPEAFGFLGADAGGISVDRGRLEVGTGETLSLVGGPIMVDGGRLRSSAGSIRLVATGAATSEAGANIRLVDGARVITQGDGGGEIMISGRRLALANESGIRAINSGPTNSTSGISVRADEALIQSNSRISTGAIASGDAGALSISITGTLRLELGVDPVDFDVFPGAIESFTSAAGDAGDIEIMSDEIVMRGGLVASTTVGSGRGGDVDIRVRALNMQGAPFDEEMINFEASIATDTIGNGGAGSVRIIADSIALGNAASVTSITFEEGNAGSVDIEAERIVMRNAFVSTETTPDAFEGGGDAGSIIITARDLTSRHFYPERERRRRQDRRRCGQHIAERPKCENH
jgi:filamentous hemagglutinin family protein